MSSMAHDADWTKRAKKLLRMNNWAEYEVR